jgi:hypothetical protein
MKQIFALAAFSCLLLATSTALAQKSWTVMVFLNGDNDLWSAGIEDFNEMETVGSTDEVDVVVQIDLPVSMHGTPPFNDTRRYHVAHDAADSSAIISPQVWPESGTIELDMGSPDTLADFVIWAVDNYPADRYALVIWDHGDGFRYTPAAPAGPYKEISDDVSSGSSISVAGGELAEAMEAITSHLGRRLDLVGLDACLMGMWEVDTVLKDYADFLVQSEETEDGDGYDYNALTAFLEASPEALPVELCAAVAQGSIESVGATLACLRTDGVDAVTAAVDDAALEIMDALPASEAGIVQAADRTMRFSDGELGDLYHFMQRLIDTAGLPQSLKDAAGAVQTAVEAAVVENRTSGFHQNAHGMSVYLPVASEPFSYDEAYREGAGAVWASTSWDEMLCSFYVLVCAPDAYEPDNSSVDAKEIGAADPGQKRSLYPLNDTDVAFARVWRGLDYVFHTEGSLDTYMWLIDEDFQLLAEDDDTGSDHNASISWTADFDGLIYVKVQHWGTTVGWGAETGRYTLNMQWGPCDQEDVPLCLDQGVCAGTERLCEGETWVCPYPESHDARDASCDGLDNDCNGAADDGYEPFTCGTGACRRESLCLGGEESCVPGEPEAAQDVTCDGIDDDCDGAVDEDTSCPGCDPADRPACLDRGVCEGTEPLCEEGEWTACNYPPEYEETEASCDGLDNDCNGLVDEPEDCAEAGPVEVMGGHGACSIGLVR